MSATCHPREPRSALLVLVVAAAASLATGAARAQSVGVDPYDPWTFQYRASTFPGAAGLSALPNQTRLSSLPSDTAPFDLDNPFSDRAASTRAGGRFVPYYARNYRDPSRTAATSGLAASGRETSYVANANDTFYKRQHDRDRQFFEALRERDPRKREQLLRKVAQPTQLTPRAAVRRPATPRAGAGAGAGAGAAPPANAAAAEGAEAAADTPPVATDILPDMSPTAAERAGAEPSLPFGRILPRSSPSSTGGRIAPSLNRPTARPAILPGTDPTATP
jgi:hypothetical protein